MKCEDRKLKSETAAIPYGAYVVANLFFFL
jgi:hypothetical protein